MSLREEIQTRGRGTVKWLMEATGLSKPTIINAIKGKACSPETASDIAKALGCPSRWTELVILRGRRRLYHSDTSAPAA